MTTVECATSSPPVGKTNQIQDAFADLLHAINQPLTALQCSLELSMSLPRNARAYEVTIRSSLELTQRLRLIVEALREITEWKSTLSPAEVFPASVLVREVMEELLPVAESRRVEVRILGNLNFSIMGYRRLISTGLFRLLEASLGLTEEGNTLKILGIEEQSAGCLVLSWTPVVAEEETMRSRLHLCSMIAQHGLRQAGAFVAEEKENGCHSCILRFELSPNNPEAE